MEIKISIIVMEPIINKIMIMKMKIKIIKHIFNSEEEEKVQILEIKIMIQIIIILTCKKLHKYRIPCQIKEDIKIVIFINFLLLTKIVSLIFLINL
jgi:hypothetical protein